MSEPTRYLDYAPNLTQMRIADRNGIDISATAEDMSTALDDNPDVMSIYMLWIINYTGSASRLTLTITTEGTIANPDDSLKISYSNPQHRRFAQEFLIRTHIDNGVHSKEAFQYDPARPRFPAVGEGPFGGSPFTFSYDGQPRKARVVVPARADGIEADRFVRILAVKGDFGIKRMRQLADTSRFAHFTPPPRIVSYV